ncbi:MAG TPA: DM13 domain-containing protein [Chitinophagaceae bacterium]|jgi:hypothetical protein|nr:DM13 domain-containing protein [Chitinophagaceae bacterium]
MMKFISVSFLSAFLLLVACKKNNTPEVDLNEMVDSTAIIKYQGNFSNGPYGTVTGVAKIFQTGSTYALKLMNFNSSNGPDLRVYLSKEMQPQNFIDLGALKATGGNQVYEINTLIDFMQYKYALIHCRQYNHLFGWSVLQ